MKKITDIENENLERLLAMWLNNAKAIYTPGEEWVLKTSFSQFPEEMFVFATILYEQGKDASLLIDLLRKNKLDHILLTLERHDFSN